MSLERITGTPTLPARSAAGHKGTFGQALIIAGSRGMSGAACLSGSGALRGGCGLVYLAVPAGIQTAVCSHEPSYLTIALPEDDAGRTTFAANTTIAQVLAGKSAVAVGPGLGQSDEITQLVCSLYQSINLPLVVDADGLNALAQCEDQWLANPPANSHDEDAPARVLTPHPGEFSRLTGKSIHDIQSNREEAAVRFARNRRVVLVLKGAGTVITDGQRIAVNETGNSGLATGGTGDVLTGLIVSLLAQGMEAFEAARLAVFLHGLAADLAVEDTSEFGLIASDLPYYLGAAWRALSTDD